MQPKVTPLVRDRADVCGLKPRPEVIPILHAILSSFEDSVQLGLPITGPGVNLLPSPTRKADCPKATGRQRTECLSWPLAGLTPLQPRVGLP